MILMAVLLAMQPAPSPTAAQPTLPTIITVTSSPYCNSLADNFNGAMLPMLANERVLDETNVQLDTLNKALYQTNYEQQFLHARDRIYHEEVTLNDSLSAISHHLAALRAGAHFSSDPQATAAIVKAADDLQTAYDHQRQLAIDLQNLYISLLRYNISAANPPMGGFSEQNLTAAPAALDVKSYLRFDNQRAVVATSLDQAVDVAYAAADKYCSAKK